MNIEYVTTYDATDIHNWSGSGYFIAKALKEQAAEVRYIGNLQADHSFLLNVKKLYYKRIKKSFLPDRDLSIARQYAKKAASAIHADTDIIFSPGSLPIALLESNKPKVFYTDATFAGMLGFYESFSNLSKETIRHGNELEQMALDSCSLAIYSSDWAAKTAIDNYNVDPAKVKVVPFGANILSQRDHQQISAIISGRSETECHLLFMGVDWARKRGELSVAVAQELNRLGLKTTLHVAGIRNLPSGLPDFVVNHGFISKSTPSGTEKINQLMSSCHFLILPTKAEAYGLVFCEAGSFGLPSIATNVGGIPSILENDVNGRMFPLSATEKEYATYIFSLFADREKYRRMAFSSFEQYENKLNWKVAGRKLISLLEKL